MYLKQSRSRFLLSLVAAFLAVERVKTSAAVAASGTSASKISSAAGYTSAPRKQPRTSKSPQPTDVPQGSTLFTLELEEEYWDVVIKNDTTFLEVQFSTKRITAAVV